MRALLLTVLVSFNLVACVTGDNDAEDQGIEGLTESQVDDMQDLDVTPGSAEHVVKQQKDIDVDLQTRPVHQNRYQEAASQEMLDGEMAKSKLQQEFSTRPVDQRNRYQETTDKEMLDGDMAKTALEQEQLGRDVDPDQVEIYNPNRIEEVDMVELLRGIHVSR